MGSSLLQLRSDLLESLQTKTTGQAALCCHPRVSNASQALGSSWLGSTGPVAAAVALWVHFWVGDRGLYSPHLPPCHQFSSRSCLSTPRNPPDYWQARWKGPTGRIPPPGHAFDTPAVTTPDVTNVAAIPSVQGWNGRLQEVEIPAPGKSGLETSVPSAHGSRGIALPPRRVLLAVAQAPLGLFSPPPPNKPSHHITPLRYVNKLIRQTINMSRVEIANMR